MRFADPKNDLAFKKIFGDERYKNILISFLNSILDFKKEMKIKDVSLTNPYQKPIAKEFKDTILDIKATNKKGDNFIVEMQRKDLGDFAKRSLYYTSKAYVEQLPKKEDYTKLKKVYFIGILDFNMFKNKKYISRHLIINQETSTQDLDDFEFTFIELPKFDKKLNELKSVLDKWIYFIKNANDLEMIPEEYEKIDEFKDAFFIASRTNWNKKEIEVYDYMALKRFDEINALNTATRKAKEEGLREGREEGLEEGRKEGRKEGREEGREEGIKEGKILIAKNAISQGLDDDTIVLITGLSKDEIVNLR